MGGFTTSKFWLAAGAACALAGPGAAQQPATPCAQQPAILAAERLLEAGFHERAEAVVTPLLVPGTAECAAPLLVRIAQARRGAEAPGRFGERGDRIWAKLEPILEWAAVLGLLTGLIFLFGGLWRLVSASRRRLGYGPWRVRSVTATADPGVLSAWRSALGQNRPSGNAALGMFGRAYVPIGKTVMIRGDFEDKTGALFTGAPAVGGVSLTWIGNVLKVVTREWHSPRRTLAVAINGREKSVIMRIDATDSSGKLRSEAMSAAWATDSEAAAEIDKLARAMALRMAHLTGEKPEDLARIRMQEGIARLDDFAVRRRSEALSEAARAFADARLLNPGDPLATLYEGIARELMEDHDVAAALFEQLIASAAASEKVKANARYNLAISHLRRYTPASLVLAEARFRDLLANPDPDLTPHVEAALANVIAQKFNFWSKFPPPDDPEDGTSQTEADAKRAQLAGWSKEIDERLAAADKALGEKPLKDDPDARAQLRWSIDNARGNHALNKAKAAAGPTGLGEDERKRSYEEALAAYRRCEVLVPPGVETLSSIASALIQLDRPSEAIRYARRARALNPAYEYAYYREAQAQHLRGDKAALRSVLNDAKAALPFIAIPGFRDLFDASYIAFHAK